MSRTTARSVEAFDLTCPCRPRQLNIAVKEGCVEEVSQLLSQGANVNRMCRGQLPLHVASEGTREDHLSANFLEVVKTLVEAGADVNYADHKRMMTPLMYACENGQSAIGSYLLKMGADLNVRNIYGTTPLLYALDSKPLNVSFISDLLKAGASVKCSDCKGSPLHAILTKPRKHSDNDTWDVLELLLSYPCDIDAKDQSRGSTPLHIAVDCNDLKSARMLIKAGCKVDIGDDLGYTPTFYAIYFEHYHHVELFLAAGGRIPQRSCINWMYLRKELERKDPSRLERWLAMGAEFPKLSDMCRRTFFDHYGTEAQRCIKKLPLPPLIKRYLSFEIL